MLNIIHSIGYVMGALFVASAILAIWEVISILIFIKMLLTFTVLFIAYVFIYEGNL